MSNLTDHLRPSHHRPNKFHRQVESPQPVARPERRSRWAIAVLAASASLAVATFAAVQTGSDTTTPAIPLPDLTGLDAAIYSSAVTTTPAIPLPDLTGLDAAIYSG